MLVRLKKGVASFSTTLALSGFTTLMPGQNYTATPEDWVRLSQYCDVVTDEFRIIEKKELNIWTLDGIGDIYWVMTKLGGIAKLCGAEKINLHIRDVSPGRPQRAEPFVRLNPLIGDVVYTDDMLTPPPEGFMVEPMEGKYDYALCANAVLESGMLLEDWLPSIPEDLDFPLDIKPMKEGDYAVFYFGDYGAEELWANGWTTDDWAHLVEFVRHKSVPSYVIGLDCDAGKAKAIEKAGAVFKSAIGQTDFVDAIRLMRGARCCVGSVSGLSIIAAARGARSVVFWPGRSSKATLPASMHYAGIKAEHYTPLTYDVSRDVAKRAINAMWRHGIVKGNMPDPAKPGQTKTVV